MSIGLMLRLPTREQVVTLVVTNWQREISIKDSVWNFKLLATEICKLIESYEKFVANWRIDHPTITNTAYKTHNLLENSLLDTSLILSTNVLSLYTKDKKSIKIKLLNGLFDTFEFGLFLDWTKTYETDNSFDLDGTLGYWMSASKVKQHENCKQLEEIVFEDSLEYKKNDIVTVSVEKTLVIFEYNNKIMYARNSQTADYDYVFGIKLGVNSSVEVV